ncbi:MAG TPA: DHHA2 domain-containing protein [Parachlamydiaceae bacterium]|nr:DHHA2 domain-containing protein [Parachlamydiaceae bacterium]
MKILLSLFMAIPLSLMSFEVQSQNLISDFLHSSKIRYEKGMVDPQNSATIHFVMGNESADLDSITSSIAYAYLLDRENHTSQTELYIPLINIPREELALRKDVLYLLNLLNISVDDILFLDDNTVLDSLFAQKRLRLNLVDHNVLKPKLEHLSDAVERIIDHHHEENKFYPLIAKNDKSIIVVGSNATLVAEKILFSSQVKMFPQLAVLLLAPILIDTSNLKAVEKTTCRDVGTTKALRNFTSTLLPADFYQKLLAAKNDISGLTPTMLLTKDFKEYLDGSVLYGISSIASAICWTQVDLDIVGPEIQKYARKRNLDYLILLMSCKETQAKRKLLVYSPSMDLLRAFNAYVQDDEILKELLIPDGFSEKYQTAFYKTEKSVARKQLQPLFDFSGSIPAQRL